MKEYKIKGTALRDYNDTIRKIKVEKDEEVIEERARYEELKANGFVDDGTIIEPKTRKTDNYKNED